MVINFGSKDGVMALSNRCFEANVQNAQDRPSPLSSSLKQQAA
jgi:hypothetical protein